MTTRVVTVHPDSTIGDAARLMLDCKISGLPVVDVSGRVVGIVTEHDLLRRQTNGPGSEPPHWLQLMIERAEITKEFSRFYEARVEEVMTRDPLMVTEDTPIAEACRVIGDRGIKRLPVVRDGKLVGIVARADLLRALTIAVREVNHARERTARAEALMADFQREAMLRRARARS
jgi:CBS domain-containing protein